MSMYADYIREKACNLVLEKEYGFCIYHYETDDLAVFVDEIYVVPNRRRNGCAAALVNEVVKAARGRGAKHMLCALDPSSMTATLALQCMLAYGFRPSHTAGKFYILIKDL